MFKSIALKLSAAVLGILSIFFSGVINDALRVDAATDDYSNNAYNLGMFDTVDSVNGTVSRQTGYLTISLNQINNMSFPDGANPNRNGVFIGLINLGSNVVSAHWGDMILYCSDGRLGYEYNDNWCPANLVDKWILHQNNLGFAFSTASVSDRNSKYAAMKSYVSSHGGFLYFQYLLDSPTVVSFNDAINGDNAHSAYSEGYSEGYSDGKTAAIDIDQSITVRVGSNSYGFKVKVTLGDGSVIEQELNAYAPYVSFRRSQQSVAKIELSDSYSDEQPYFNVSFVSGVTTYSGIYNALVVGGVVYLPTWENPIDVVVRTTGASDFSAVNDLRFDPANFNNVFVGSGPYSEGYEAGKSYGEDHGYSSGHSAGYSDGYAVGYGEGQAAGASGGWLEGYSAGVAQGGGNVEMIDVWPLMGAVVTMPFTFFSQGLDWTLFKGSPYEFGVSIFFGSVLVILMLWKIIQLVIGLGK